MAKKNVIKVNQNAGLVLETPNAKLEVKGYVFTEKQVTAFLQKQIADCADTIQGDTLSESTAKRKILAVKLVEVK